jgi:hypothetical protein
VLNGNQTNYPSAQCKDKALRSFETSVIILCQAVQEEQSRRKYGYITND